MLCRLEEYSLELDLLLQRFAALDVLDNCIFSSLNLGELSLQIPFRLDLGSRLESARFFDWLRYRPRIRPCR